MLREGLTVRANRKKVIHYHHLPYPILAQPDLISPRSVDLSGE
jgi:hypothetical protein